MPVENSVFEKLDDVSNFILNNYGFLPTQVTKLSRGSANCFKIVHENKNFFLKELQEKFTRESLEREIALCQLIKHGGIPTSEFVKTVKGGYICEESGRLLHMQIFIDGRTYERNRFEDSLLFQSADLLGRIHCSLANVSFLPEGFSENWFVNWNIKDSLKKYMDIKEKVKHADLRKDLQEKVISACDTKINLLNHFDMDYIPLKNLKSVNSHGDYNNLQLICNKKNITAVIDFSSAAKIPAVWEIIRSYTYCAKECCDGKEINFMKLKHYIDSYLKKSNLSQFDIDNMIKFYYFNLLRSSFGLNATDEEMIEFGLWRANLCEYLSKVYHELTDYLHMQYLGQL